MSVLRWSLDYEKQQYYISEKDYADLLERYQKYIMKTLNDMKVTRAVQKMSFFAFLTTTLISLGFGYHTL